MMSKRFKALLEKVTPKHVYPLDEAIKLAKETATTTFDSAIEIHINTAINANRNEEQVRSTVVLPHGTGRAVRVAAFVDNANEKVAQDAGADVVGGEELIDIIAQKKTIDFDVAIATPSLMPKLAKIAKVLGPRGLMPSPKNETVGPDVAAMVTALKKGKLAFKNDDSGNIHAAIGRASFTEAQLKDNIIAFVDALKAAKPPATKGNYIKSITLSSTMGPGVRTSV